MKKEKIFIRNLKRNDILMEFVAEKLGISPSEFSEKLNAPMKFTLAELALLKGIFHMSARDTINFFAPSVAYRNY